MVPSKVLLLCHKHQHDWSQTSNTYANISNSILTSFVYMDFCGEFSFYPLLQDEANNTQLICKTMRDNAHGPPCVLLEPLNYFAFLFFTKASIFVTKSQVYCWVRAFFTKWEDISIAVIACHCNLKFLASLLGTELVTTISMEFFCIDVNIRETLRKWISFR